ncbi:MAG: alpha/beta hydrolase [Lachnospiraceae bacterium]|nr:alpha/beta hydrolase [Lachnospiraceae bacterium]
MALSEERYNELKEILTGTRPPVPDYPDEIKAYLELADSEKVVRTAGGQDYTIYIRKAHNQTPASPLYIYMHGGGWAVGHEACDDYYSCWMADQIGGVVIDVDYTTSFYGDLDVMYAQTRDALEYAAAQAEALGCDPARIVMGGFSAGGHLTAGTVLRMLEEDKCPLAGVILAYSPLDLRLKPRVAPATERDKAMQVRGAAYEEMVLRGDDERRKDYIVSPLLASKLLLAKLPRTMVISAQLCEFREQDEAFAKTLSEIGIETTSCRFTFSGHGFMPHFRQEWKEASLRTARFIKSC